MVIARIREPIPPAKIITPTGVQNVLLLRIMVMTPVAVVAVVRKIGTTVSYTHLDVYKRQTVYMGM